MLKFIRPLYFFLSFGLGLLFVYAFAPKPEIVMKFPSPYNAGSIQYKDRDNKCYVIKATNTHCPVDKSLIKPQPIH